MKIKQSAMTEYKCHGGLKTQITLDLLLGYLTTLFQSHNLHFGSQIKRA
jgi:hypothetical protein